MMCMGEKNSRITRIKHNNKKYNNCEKRIAASNKRITIIDEAERENYNSNLETVKRSQRSIEQK